VEDLAGERLEAGQLGQERLGERSAGGDQDVGAVAAPRGIQHPAPRRLVPVRRVHLVPQPQVTGQAAVGDGAAQVVPDLPLPGKAARPQGIGREGQRVHVRRNVTRAARIGIVAPRAADVVAAVEDEEVAVTLLEESDPGADAAEAGPDDRDPRVSRTVHPLTPHAERYRSVPPLTASYHRVGKGGR
jgi:hypothetical protein